MAIEFTPEQEQVIKLRNRNILVSAAAGSGKTAVLVERIIARLTKDEDLINIDELLIVTYTEAAAAEMKERIQSAIEKALEEHPENVHLQNQATLIHQARITTIHGFCLSVIRDYFHNIDLDPGFRIAEEGELKLLKHDVVEELIEAYYGNGTPEFLDFVECYASGKDDRRLEEIILQLYALSRSQLNPKEWLEECIAEYEISSVEELEARPFVKHILEEVKRNILEWLSNLKYAMSICDSEEGPEVYRNALELDYDMLEGWLEITSFGEMQEVMGNAKLARLAACKNPAVSEQKINLVKEIREEIRSGVKKLAQQFFYEPIEELQKDMQRTANNMGVLAEMVTAFTVAYGEKKRSKNMIDFEDMERFALEILTVEEEGQRKPSSAAEELQEKFAEVMIDEYQDSNLIQEAILTSVSKVSKGTYNVFMVGDVKQSIYKFRLSKPELFMEKFHTYSLEESHKQRIDLHKNFRSRKEVLSSTNFVFEQIMTESFGGITYDDKAALYFGANYEDRPGNETEVIFVEAEGLSKNARIEMEARTIAKRIKQLVGTHEIFDKKLEAYRKVQFGDIVLLTRSLTGWADVLSEILLEDGIPTYTSSREGYFQTREIKLILDYLRILDNPYQDIPFTAVLLSMFANMKEEELAQIKSTVDEKSMYKCVQAYMETGESEELKKKLISFMQTYEKFRGKVAYTAIHTLLWKIIAETGYGDYIAALPGGSQRSANLEMLLAKAVSFESTSYKGLFNFIRYIEQLHKYNVDYGEANLSDDHMDAVSIMSIHKSKGLEFPIVILAGMGKLFNTQDANSSIVVHSELGVGLDAIDPALRTKIPTLHKKNIQRQIVLENAAEELRVLYVAMTRAKEKLIMTGFVKNLEEKLRKYIKLENRNRVELSYGDLTKASSYWDWVIPALFRNKCMADVLEECGIYAPFTNKMFHLDIPIVVQRITEEELQNLEVEEQLVDEITKDALEYWGTDKVYDEEMKTIIETQFSYEYPMLSNQRIKQKMSVSELKKMAYEEEMGETFFKEEDVIPLLPNFMQEKAPLSGAMRGTAYHKVLELWAFDKDYSEEEIGTVIWQFVKDGYMEKEAAECISEKAIYKFLQSPIGKRLQVASRQGKFHAEQPFVLGISARDVYGDEVSDETMLVQGIIDVYFEEDGELVVLDYKTDKVFHRRELVEKYSAQLEYYGTALERLTGKKVKQKMICSFSLQEEIEV